MGYILNFIHEENTEQAYATISARRKNYCLALFKKSVIKVKQLMFLYNCIEYNFR